MNGTIFCNKCGAPNTAGAQFCSRCGTGMAGAVAPAPVTTQPPVPYAAPIPQASGAAYGGFWIRVVASIVDAIVVRAVVAPIGFMFGGMSLLGGMGHGFPHTGFALLGGGVTIVLVLAGQWLYEAFLESSSYQATLGKMIFGMKVTDLNGNRISFARATGRHFAKIVSGLVMCIGLIMVGLTERKQGLHDLMAGTLVRRY